MSSWITLEQGKTRLGIPSGDTSKDAEVQAAIDYATDLVEEYCQREFAQGAYTEQVFKPTEKIIYLNNWPAASVDEIRRDAVVYAEAVYDLNPIHGEVHFDAGQTNFSDTVLLEIDYTGGYNPVPDVLTNAVLDVMKIRYDTFSEDPSLGPLKFERVDGYVSRSYGDPYTSLGNDGMSRTFGPALDIINKFRSERTQGSWQ